MLTNEQTNAVRPISNVMLVIFVALVLGPLFFAVITLFLRFSNDTEPAIVGGMGLLPIIGWGVAVFNTLLSFVVPAIVLKSHVSKTAQKFSGVEIEGVEAAKDLAQGFQTSTIIKLALLEGAIFVNLMFLLIQGKFFNLIAAAMLFMVMLLAVPLQSRVINKVESMLEKAKFLQKTV